MTRSPARAPSRAAGTPSGAGKRTGTVRSRSTRRSSSPATFIFIPWASGSAGTALPSMQESSGYGSLTGIHLPDEKPGLIPTTEWKKKRTGEAWYPGDTYINSIGQGFVLVSPIQACQMISAIANGGIFYRPMLLKQTRNRETGRRSKRLPLTHETTITLDPVALDEVQTGAGRRGQRTGRHRPRGRRRRLRPWPARPARPRSSPRRSPDRKLSENTAGPRLVRRLCAGRQPEDRRGRARRARRPRRQRGRAGGKKSHRGVSEKC